MAEAGPAKYEPEKKEDDEYNKEVWGLDEVEILISKKYGWPYPYGTEVEHKVSGEKGMVIGLGLKGRTMEKRWDGTYTVSYGFDKADSSVHHTEIEPIE